MELLSETISAFNRTYKLVERIDNCAIYETFIYGNIEYEVIRIRVEKAKIFNGYSFPDREVYPSSSEWGKYGFTFTTNSHSNPLKSAKEKLAELVNNSRREF